MRARIDGGKGIRITSLLCWTSYCFLKYVPVSSSPYFTYVKKSGSLQCAGGRGKGGRWERWDPYSVQGVGGRVADGRDGEEGGKGGKYAWEAKSAQDQSYQ